MAAEQTVSLYDSTTDTLIEVKLSNEDAIRAHNDTVFATQLMNAALREKISANSLACDEPQPGPSSIQDNATISEYEKQASMYRWNRQSVLLLLESYRNFEKKMENGKQKSVWEEIAKLLRAKDYNVTGEQCSSKLRSLKKTYKTTKEANAKSGNSPSHWEHYATMDELFGKRAWCAPVALASSTGLSKNSTDKSSEESSSGTSNPSTSKETAISLMKKRLEQKEQFENARVLMDEKFLAVLQKLAEK